MKVGLFVGRFQPFHNGHLEIIKQMNEECDQIIIVIGSAQISHTKYNPFNASERYQMINKSLEMSDHITGNMYKFYKLGEGKVHIIPVMDIDRYDLYVKHIESLVPPFNIVYSNSPVVLQLFTEAGYEVKTPEYTTLISITGQETSKRLSASFVRDSITNITNIANYQDYVPQGTKEVIEQINGVKRLKQINRGD